MHRHASQPSTQDRSDNFRRLGWTLALVAVYMVAEAAGGWFTHSLALLADAGHMFSDAASLGLALFALWIARRPATDERTFGYHRTEILAALANGAALAAVALVIVGEAVARFSSPRAVDAPAMTWIAVGGLAVNLAGLALLRGGRHGSLNVRGAWLHVATDTLGSVQAIAAGALIWAFGWQWADPLASVLIALLVVRSAWSLLRDSLHVLMESTPSRLDAGEVRAALVGVPGVEQVHDLHLWTITSGFESLSVHARVAPESDRDETLIAMRRLMRDRFAVDHSTIQLEGRGCEEGRCD
jgi:cobalt-zinc-cadmium efflux system protein